MNILVPSLWQRNKEKIEKWNIYHSVYCLIKLIISIKMLKFSHFSNNKTNSIYFLCTVVVVALKYWWKWNKIFNGLILTLGLTTKTNWTNFSKANLIWMSSGKWEMNKIKFTQFNLIFVDYVYGDSYDDSSLVVKFLQQTLFNWKIYAFSVKKKSSIKSENFLWDQKW